MEKRYVAALAVVMAMLVAGGVLAVTLINSQAPNAPVPPKQYTYQIVKTYPHDNTAFTEGLAFSDGSLYESTGEYGSSSLRRVNLETGSVNAKYFVAYKVFWGRLSHCQ